MTRHCSCSWLKDPDINAWRMACDAMIKSFQHRCSARGRRDQAYKTPAFVALSESQYFLAGLENSIILWHFQKANIFWPVLKNQ
jgi:hypothetical protein